MRKCFSGAALAAVLLFTASAGAGDDYAVDGMHAGVSFKISHLGLSWTYGRFNEMSGDFTLDPADPSKSSFNLSIQVNSVDTNNKKRDDHLRSPDFFNVK